MNKATTPSGMSVKRNKHQGILESLLSDSPELTDGSSAFQIMSTKNCSLRSLLPIVRKMVFCAVDCGSGELSLPCCHGDQS